MVIAAMACAVLLLAFERVVRQAVQQGELRQIAARDRSDAIWRCKALKTRTARAECRQGLT
jgi:hydroxymethylglutaryl-CoA reductase